MISGNFLDTNTLQKNPITFPWFFAYWSEVLYLKEKFFVFVEGMNAVVRSYVRMALYHGCKVYGIKNSFGGLCRGEVQVSECIVLFQSLKVGRREEEVFVVSLFRCFIRCLFFMKKLLKDMTWGDVSNWVMYGGSFLGTQKQLPDKIMDKVADAFEKYNFHGLLLVGGFEVSIYKLFIISNVDFSRFYLCQINSLVIN